MNAPAKSVLDMAATNEYVVVQIVPNPWNVNDLSRQAEYRSAEETRLAPLKPYLELCTAGLLKFAEPRPYREDREYFQITEKGLAHHRAVGQRES